MANTGVASKAWFEVDKDGLAQILERRGKEFAVLELFQNAADAGAKHIRIDLVAHENRGYSTLTVTDDDPDGFADLRDAFTLFAPSRKKGDPTKAGRFNLGEKLVLAICSQATIASTKGRVGFDSTGRWHSRTVRPVGTEFTGTVKMTKGERDEAVQALHEVIVPTGISLVVNDVTISPRPLVESVGNVTLDTERSDADGNLRRTKRQTTLNLYEPPTGKKARLYELGIPVCETDDRWDVDVQQKVPLNMDRDGVTAAYLRAVRVAVANHMADKLTSEDTASTWAVEALSSPDIDPEAARAIVTTRFGDKAFIHNPADPEATRIAVGQGFTPVYGAALPKAAWENVREILRTAPPSPKVEIQSSANGDPEYFIPRDKWTPAMLRMADYATYLGVELLGFRPRIQFTAKASFNASAAWGNRTLTFNKFRLGNAFFENPQQESVDDLLIHEFGHEFGEHLDPAYGHGLTKLAAKAITLARAGKLKTLYQVGA